MENKMLKVARVLRVVLNLAEWGLFLIGFVAFPLYFYASVLTGSGSLWTLGFYFLVYNAFACIIAKRKIRAVRDFYKERS